MSIETVTGEDMNIKYRLWAFKSTIKITSIFFAISIFVWLLSPDRHDVWGGSLIVLSWIFYFTIHVKDPKTERKYYLLVIKPELDRQE